MVGKCIKFDPNSSVLKGSHPIFSEKNDFQLKFFLCLIIAFFVNRFKSMSENVSNLIQILVFSRAHIPFSPESDFQLKILTGRHELSIIFHILIKITFIVHCVKSILENARKFIQILVFSFLKLSHLFFLRHVSVKSK